MYSSSGEDKWMGKVGRVPSLNREGQGGREEGGWSLYALYDIYYPHQSEY